MSVSTVSKEEVDALMSDISSEGNAGESLAVVDDVREIDFFNQERVVRSQFPVLERMHERFAKKIETSIYDLMSRQAMITLSPLKVIKAGDFMAQLKMPTAINIARFHPLRGKAMFLFEDNLVFSLVENYFGGDGRFKSKIEEREFTKSELRIMSIIRDVLVNDLEEIWKPIKEINVEIVGCEMNPQIVSVASANELMITSNVEILFNDYGGNFTIAIPYSMLDPIKEQLDIGTGRADEDVDPNWTSSLQTEILDVALVVSSELTSTSISLKRLLTIKEGDVIPIEMPELVIVDIGGVPSFRAKYGVSNDKCALKIAEKVDR